MMQLSNQNLAGKVVVITGAHRLASEKLLHTLLGEKAASWC
ncbi:hypothetical protein RCF98_04570 [Thiothrix lacustris]|uniref:Short-chain dehydrogenase n=1 Tax=Thiothrix lacustris TaxID=525917 RepID=A0ABY9MSI8_9GAMM|nr:hypothetical protein [Thiothrix lacustris]WML91616.1 hypothetical protein RCF98_04570 [Thiothrix lacustris]